MRTVFIGHDPRQPLSYNVMKYSVERHASRPISTVGLILDQLPMMYVVHQDSFSAIRDKWGNVRVDNIGSPDFDHIYLKQQ